MTTYGSSSGSAVAVSANLAMASLATDTCGSLITPSSAGMVVGSKASYGRISNSGIVPLAPSLDSVRLLNDANMFRLG
ncbi:hypothetical protein DSO57_1035384 [Entomophthora muscae]|uniref:Uncharacterized protein n=1 Tax=Entomophthora muscae TaxID=34485 RepID=A0ACC2RQF8_9FUNG|nr:hypothetical protein DSO57_1035384 [Entomophthora muscae]